jgi:hypothetical protein
LKIQWKPFRARLFPWRITLSHFFPSEDHQFISDAYPSTSLSFIDILSP